MSNVSQEQVTTAALDQQYNKQVWAWDVEARHQDPQLQRLRRDTVTSREVKVYVVLIAVVKLSLYVTFITSWRVNAIINYRLAMSNCTHIAQVCIRSTYYLSWTRDINGWWPRPWRQPSETETRARRWLHQPRWDRLETKKSIPRPQPW